MNIAFVNQKGGVGKTTTTINVAAYLAQLGRRVLLVDLDPQANATSGVGVSFVDDVPSLYHVLIGAKTVKEAAVTHKKAGYDVLPGSNDLAAAVIELVDVEDREYRLRRALDEVADDYDIVLIDCPPSLGLLTINGLVAADALIIPVQCEYYALEGLGQLMSTIELVVENLHPELDVLGVVMTMFDRRNSLSHQVLADIRKNFPGRVFHAVIPRNTKLAEAPSHGESILHYDPHSKGAVAYKRLADEVQSIVFND